jgi:hypothetical protein
MNRQSFEQVARAVYGDQWVDKIIDHRDDFNTDWLNDVVTKVDTKYQDIEFNNDVTLDDLIELEKVKK